MRCKVKTNWTLFFASPSSLGVLLSLLLFAPAIVCYPEGSTNYPLWNFQYWNKSILGQLNVWSFWYWGGYWKFLSSFSRSFPISVFKRWWDDSVSGIICGGIPFFDCLPSFVFLYCCGLNCFSFSPSQFLQTSSASWYLGSCLDFRHLADIRASKFGWISSTRLQGRSFCQHKNG